MSIFGISTPEPWAKRLVPSPVFSAMSTAEIGRSLADMIRAGHVAAISCTGANLEEDVFNLVAHDAYVKVPSHEDLSPQDDLELFKRHLNRVTDVCIPEEEAIRRLEHR
jgi:deoxyhypusine synthase